MKSNDDGNYETILQCELKKKKFEREAKKIYLQKNAN